MISPFSISSALSMNLNGASGKTFEAMQKALRLNGKTLEQINDTYLKLRSEIFLISIRPEDSQLKKLLCGDCYL